MPPNPFFLKFPSSEWATDEGLLAIGGDLEVDTLISAYSQGVFPWPSNEGELLWFTPPQRAILEFKDLHIPKRLKQYLKHSQFEFRVNTDFTKVIKACAQSKNRKRGGGTWIFPEMIEAYSALHAKGFATSFEVYNKKGELVGGLYGVRIKKYFAAESMFYLESFASQFVLIETVRQLSQEGLSWMDVQVLNPHLEKFGVKEVERALFLEKLDNSLSLRA